MEKKDLKLAILQSVRDAGKAIHKMNLIGRGYQAGGLEQQLKTTFDNASRAQASLVFEELKVNDLIRPTFSDSIDPENWVEITDKGRTALEKGDSELEGPKPVGETREWDQKFGLLLSPKQAERVVMADEVMT